MKNIIKTSTIIVLLIVVSISSIKAQFYKENGDFFEWGGTYKYTTSLDENYSLQVWGYEGEFGAILSYSDEFFNYEIDCTVVFLETNNEVMWETMYIKYDSVKDGLFLYEEDFEDLIEEREGSKPVMFILHMSSNEIYTETLDLNIEDVEPETPTKNIFIKE